MKLLGVEFKSGTVTPPPPSDRKHCNVTVGTVVRSRHEISVLLTSRQSGG